MKKELGEKVEMFTDFWLGVASAGAQGVADIAKGLKERKERHFDSRTAAADLQVVLDAAAKSLQSVAKDAAALEKELAVAKDAAALEKALAVAKDAAALEKALAREKSADHGKLKRTPKDVR
jgi:hypothetical protein